MFIHSAFQAILRASQWLRELSHEAAALILDVFFTLVAIHGVILLAIGVSKVVAWLYGDFFPKSAR